MIAILVVAAVALAALWGCCVLMNWALDDALKDLGD